MRFNRTGTITFGELAITTGANELRQTQEIDYLLETTMVLLGVGGRYFMDMLDHAGYLRCSAVLVDRLTYGTLMTFP